MTAPIRKAAVGRDPYATLVENLPLRPLRATRNWIAPSG